VLSFTSVHSGLHALILLPKPYNLAIWVHTWLVMLIPKPYNQCCGLSMGWNGGDGWIPSGDVVCHAQNC
jgi:hypothetical protein